MGDDRPKNETPARPPARQTERRDVPSHPPSASLAADLLGDLGKPPDLQLTEVEAPDAVVGSAPLDPSGFGGSDASTEGSTERIDLQSRPEAAPTPRVRAGGSLQTLGPTLGPGSEPMRDEPTVRDPEGPAPDRGIHGIPIETTRPAAVPRAPAAPEREAGARPPAPAPRAPSVPKRGAAPRLTLPCNVLVVDDDRRAGAQTAARLMEAGCTCRVVGSAEAEAALAQVFQVVLLEVPAAEVRADGGAGRIGSLGGFTGPLVLTSAAAIEVLPPGAGAAVTKPYFLEDLIIAIETARSEPPAGLPRALDEPPAARPEATKDLDPVEAIAHHDLDKNVVRAMLTRADGQISRGRVRTMSYDGELLVALNGPLRREVEVAVELALADGRRMEIPGVVTRSSGTDMEVSLKLGDSERLFVRHFLDQARDVTQAFIEPVRIRTVSPVGPSAVVDDTKLEELWRNAAANLQDNGINQQFIQACLKGQRLEHAVRCYRRLKEERPDDQEQIDKYLAQVGTILGFYAFKKEVKEVDDSKLPMSIKIALALFIGAALILWVMITVMN